ncbi:MAG: LacI family DNA-binding transcriptional regulator [Trueperaceae bacterium]
MARLKDVAQRAGVSTATVSNVLRGAKPATPAVQRRVLAAAAELGYVPNPHAQSLRTGHSRALGLVVPDLTNPYFPALVQAIEATARALGYALIVMDAGNDGEREHDSLVLLATYRVAGVVWVPVDDRQTVDWPFPIVTVDRPLDGCDAVVADHAQGGALVAAHAIARGHRRVGLLSGPRALASAAARRTGFLGAAAGALEIAWEHEVPFSSELPPAAVERLAAPDCSLVVCANDAIAVGALRALRAAGARVPQDVSVIGFDDVPWAEFVEPALTTVRQPLAALGAGAVAMLHARIAAPGDARRFETHPVTLVTRRSVADRQAATVAAAPPAGGRP